MNQGHNQNFATFSQRLLAHNIDLIPILILFYLSTLLPKSDFDYLVLLVIYVLYHSLFELSNWRASPGKKWTKLQVVNSSTRLPRAFAIPLRNSCKVFSIVFLFAGFIMIAIHPRGQGLHDYIAGTLVLFDRD